MNLVLDRQILSDFERSVELEWLETNGIGGWASSTLSGTHSRRYHGMLVAALNPPLGRTVLVSRLDETLVVGDERHEISCRRFPDVVTPRGFQYLERFERDLFPVFEFVAGGARLRKTVAAIDGENTTAILYEVVDASQPIRLELRPLLTRRDYHALGAPSDLGMRVSFDGRQLLWSPGTADLELAIGVSNSCFTFSPDWYRRFTYHEEQRRGLDAEEDLWTPGWFDVELVRGARIGVLLSTQSVEGRDAFRLVEREAARREAVVAASGVGGTIGRQLTLAADQFVVRRGTDLRTIIAGYHWFGDWGRDTMIALPGLCLATRRFEDAAKILRAFAGNIDQGMLPNRFPDSGDIPEYNTVDATLWFFVAVWRYLEATKDDEFFRHELLPVLRDIVDWHDRGTRFGIGVDPADGLLVAGEPGVQLTWMDAKVGDWVVTPRQGKPVEINALWYNALRILSDLEARFGDGATAQRLAQRAGTVRETFRRAFWHEERGYLADVVGDGFVDASLRPNQLLALSLPFPLLDGPEAVSILDVVEERLLTPVGLRSLDAGHPEYRAHYGGGPVERDGAYHQGTVWGWLLGPFLTALVRVRGEAGREQARERIEGAIGHLRDGGTVGSYSEIFDADPPHAARGCAAQAWSIAELLRVVDEDLEQR